jgi:hypothetical protein
MYSYKSNSAVKNSILAFVKNLVSKKIYAAIKILLNPCCTPVILSAETVCDSENPGKTILTVKFDKNITTFGNSVTSFYVVVPSNNVFIGSDSVDLTNGIATFSFEGLQDATLDIFLEIFMPTNSEGTIGVSATSQGFQVYFRDCRP